VDKNVGYCLRMSRKIVCDFTACIPKEEMVLRVSFIIFLCDSCRTDCIVYFILLNMGFHRSQRLIVFASLLLKYLTTDGHLS
jgi:hypothetical protein